MTLRDDAIRKARAKRYARLPDTPLSKEEAKPRKPPRHDPKPRPDNTEARKRAVEMVRNGSTVTEAARAVKKGDTAVRAWCVADGVDPTKRGTK